MVLIRSVISERKSKNSGFPYNLFSLDEKEIQKFKGNSSNVLLSVFQIRISYLRLTPGSETTIWLEKTKLNYSDTSTAPFS